MDIVRQPRLGVLADNNLFYLLDLCLAAEVFNYLEAKMLEQNCGTTASSRIGFSEARIPGQNCGNAASSRITACIGCSEASMARKRNEDTGNVLVYVEDN